MSAENPQYRMIVLTQRLKLPGIMDTMSDQAPLIQAELAHIMERLPGEIDALDGHGWGPISHSVTIHSGLLIATFLMRR
jgi:hypothetical protein